MLFTAITEEELLSLEGNVDPNVNKSDHRAATVVIGTGAGVGAVAGRYAGHKRFAKAVNNTGKRNKLQKAFGIQGRIVARDIMNNVVGNPPAKNTSATQKATKLANKTIKSVRYGRHWGKIGAVAGGTIAAGTALAILRKRQKQR